MFHYAYRVFWHEPDQSYVSVMEGVAELKRLSAFGDTPEEALADMATVLQLVEESYRTEGREMPQPAPAGAM